VYVPKSSPTAWNYEQPPLSILESSIKLEEQMLATMRDICGVNAYVSGTSDQQIDQKTASGINLIQSAAAKRFQQIKNQIGLSLRRVGLDEIDLNQQFFNKAMAVPLMGLPADLPPGKSAADYFTTVTPGRPDGSGDRRHRRLRLRHRGRLRVAEPSAASHGSRPPSRQGPRRRDVDAAATRRRRRGRT
jgi:hypothetical protein